MKTRGKVCWRIFARARLPVCHTYSVVLRELADFAEAVQEKRRLTMYSVESQIDTKLSSKYLDLEGTRFHYLEVGQGDPVLFLHGCQPLHGSGATSCPILRHLGRCIAPDFAGFGNQRSGSAIYSRRSPTLSGEILLRTLGLNRITMVVHGWGSILGLDYAMRHEEKCGFGIL